VYVRVCIVLLADKTNISEYLSATTVGKQLEK